MSHMRPTQEEKHEDHRGVYTDAEPLRDINLEGYRLRIWERPGTTMGKTRLAYCFADSLGETVFQGEDFGASPMHAIDSDATVRALLTFITLQPGDTDLEYFAGYTERQWAFVESDCDSLSVYASEPSHDWIELSDDGTMDTVFECGLCNEDIRYQGDSFERDPESGALVDEEAARKEVFADHECKPFPEWDEDVEEEITVKPSGARDCWRVFIGGEEQPGVIEPYAHESEALAAARLG